MNKMKLIKLILAVSCLSIIYSECMQPTGNQERQNEPQSAPSTPEQSIASTSLRRYRLEESFDLRSVLRRPSITPLRTGLPSHIRRPGPRRERNAENVARRLEFPPLQIIRRFTPLTPEEFRGRNPHMPVLPNQRALVANQIAALEALIPRIVDHPPIPGSPTDITQIEEEL